MFTPIDFLPYVVSLATGIAGWWVGRKKQKNDFLSDLQSSIDLLSEKNKTLLDEVVKLRGENATLHVNQEIMLSEMSTLRDENSELRKDIEAMSELLTSLKVPLPPRRKRITKTTQTTTE